MGLVLCPISGLKPPEGRVEEGVDGRAVEFPHPLRRTEMLSERWLLIWRNQNDSTRRRLNSELFIDAIGRYRCPSWCQHGTVFTLKTSWEGLDFSSSKVRRVALTSTPLEDNTGETSHPRGKEEGEGRSTKWWVHKSDLALPGVS